MRGRELRQTLAAAPLRYRPVATGSGGSHTKLISAAGYPPLMLAFHNNQEIPPGLVRKILVKDVGLSVDAALGILRR